MASTQLPLEFLSLADTAEYLSVHFQPNDFPATFAAVLHRQSLSLSSEQRAKSYSLRSAVGLSRVPLLHRCYDEANLLLSNHLASFDEGFTTTDWREGERILHELKHCIPGSLSLS
ncbi:hypothetical protein [Methylotuvimicrobium sp. KM1]|uniref:hypothetical protein n=1 Tax=Methylotuvimicrobium sp. KM1 TaxID=3377707 RepID=UPI00384F9A6E